MDFSNIEKIANMNKTSKIKETRKIPKMSEAQEVKRGVLNLSNKAEEIKFAFKALNSVPDIREDKMKEALDVIKNPDFFEKNITNITQKMVDTIFKGVI